MRKLDRYIGSSVLGATAGVLAVLVGLDALSVVIDESQDLTERYTFLQVMLYVFLTLPRRIHEFIPYATLIGSLIGLGRLASSSELTVARAAGLSVPAIGASVLKPALLVAIFGFLIGEFIAPASEQLAVSQRALAQRSEAMVAGRHGTWNRDGNTFIHVDAVQRGGVVFGVTLLKFDDKHTLIQSQNAARGTFLSDRWVLENVVTTEFRGDHTEVHADTTLDWETAITPDLLVLEVVEPSTLPVTQLWPYARYLAGQGLMFADIELAFWRKLLQPLTVAGLVLVAMSFIFGPLREGTMGGRIFVGVLVGVVFRISQDFFGPASLIFGFPPVLAAAAPIAICWLAASYLLLRRT